MIYIQHRVNVSSQLELLDPTYGCEIDLRSDVMNPGSLHLSHDPWVQGESFEEWLSLFKQRGINGPLILNTKEDGLETQIQLLLQKYSIENYFFLDTTVPTLINSVLVKNETKFAIRISKYEDQSFARKFINKVDWIWLDCFHQEIPNPEWISEIKSSFKICLVSPELQGGDPSKIESFKSLAPHLDAVCTKRVDLWKA